MDKVKVKCTASSINKAYRKKPNLAGKSGVVIVKFNLASLHDDLIDQTKKGKVTAADLGFQTNASRIYVNHEMTQKEKTLFVEARKLQKAENWKFVWEKRGLVFVRQKEGSEAIKIKSMDHLCSLVKV